MMSPLFLAFFFGIFHLLGGMAVGRGMRNWRQDPDNGLSLLLWGILLGLGPILFDWLFLLREGQVLYGMIGPAVFILAALFVYFFWSGKLAKKDEKTIISLLMGIVATLVGLGVTPILIAQARTHELTAADWIFGPCIAILPFFVGVNFIWLAVKALRKNQTFDEVAAEEEEKQEKAITAKRKKQRKG